MPPVLATLLSATLNGITGRVVRVEVDVAPGLPGFTIVGLPDAALSEARERVRGALRNAGFHHPPRRITVNLAPAELRKAGRVAGPRDRARDPARARSSCAPARGGSALIGELGLGGEVRRVPGHPADGHGARGRAASAGSSCRPRRSRRRRSRPGIEPIPVVDRRRGGRGASGRRGRAGAVAVAAAAGDERRRRGTRPPARRRSPRAADEPVVDLADVRGQAVARRALEIALAGGHAMLLIGPPGSGKTLLARTIPGLLPDLDDAAALVGDGRRVGGERRRRSRSSSGGRPSARRTTRSPTPAWSAAGRGCRPAR